MGRATYFMVNHIVHNIKRCRESCNGKSCRQKKRSSEHLKRLSQLKEFHLSIKYITRLFINGFRIFEIFRALKRWRVDIFQVVDVLTNAPKQK